MAPRSDKRRLILDAALELFAEFGFHGTAVPAVAKKAGVGAGTIYRYFDSKEALVNALYQEHKGLLTAHVVTDFPFDQPPRVQFGEFWQRMNGYALDNRTAMAFLQLHHHGDYLDAESLEIEERLHAMAAVFFAQAGAQQITKDADPELLVAVVTGAATGLLRSVFEGRITVTPQLLADAEQCVWEAIRR